MVCCWTRTWVDGRPVVDVVVDLGTFFNDLVPIVVRQTTDWAAAEASRSGSATATWRMFFIVPRKTAVNECC